MLFCPNLFAIPGMCRLCKYCTWIFLNSAESAQQKDLAKFSAKLLSGTMQYSVATTMFSFILLSHL